ncbi:aldo/keto reductase [Chryseobacterium suipulveris]|uniref:Aldo/keto reductase n=1 Tax=Chryseobacterium suipulveris TaxID=2929800 RepID=A0ABY4BKU1_9FLAO|nr:aldo/keto reductase [Chryseobacterium suipulveris]UOE39785.1 aldo/keto reductase [Chryseobacterium suipulveris]
MDYSEIIVGCMRWGIWGANHNEREVQKLIEISLEENLTTFDHADIYGNYTTAKLFGDTFAEMKIDREEVQLISKCGIEMPCSNRGFQIKSYNYSKEHIISSVENSLRNLQTDYLDLLLLHRPSPLMNPGEIATAFGVLRSSGKVLDFGVSNFSTSQFDLINDLFPLTTNQVEISINHTNSFYDETLEQMMRKKLKPMAYSVMGNYFTEKSEQNSRIGKILDELCQKYGAEENQLLLSFILKHPAKILPVIGTSKSENIQKLKQSLNINLEREDWFRLLEASKGKEVD